ncbi:MAG: response regulator [bacterium]
MVCLTSARKPVKPDQAFRDPTQVPRLDPKAATQESEHAAARKKRVRAAASGRLQNVERKGKCMYSVSSSPESSAIRSALATEKKILVVDDEPFILKSLTFVLKKEGFHVESATNGIEAMETIQREKPDLVFLDILMPKMNGLEVCQWIRQDSRLQDIYVIILTAKGQEADREKGLKIGADEYMTKPFSPSFVVKRIKEILT